MNDILELDHLAPCMRAPMWRWTVALEHMAAPYMAGPKLYADPYLATAIRFLRARDDLVRNPMNYRRRYPVMFEANLLNMCVLPNAFKWQVEALIMGGADDEYINNIYKFKCGKDTVEFYRNMFFDVNDQLDSPEVVLGNVLSTAYVNTNGQNDYDFLWKAFAYNFKADDVRHMFRQQGLLINMPRKHLSWLEEAKRNRLTYQTFAATLNFRNVYLEQSMQIWLSAAKNFQLEPGLPGSMSEDTQRSLVMKTLNGFIQETLSQPGLTTKPAQVEERLALSYASIADSHTA